MANRVTLAMLGRKVNTLNKYANGDAFALDGAYGGWRLERTTLLGGCEDAMGTGYISKPALYEAMTNFEAGIRFAYETKDRS